MWTWLFCKAAISCSWTLLTSFTMRPKCKGERIYLGYQPSKSSSTSSILEMEMYQRFQAPLAEKSRGISLDARELSGVYSLLMYAWCECYWFYSNSFWCSSADPLWANLHFLYKIRGGPRTFDHVTHKTVEMPHCSDQNAAKISWYGMTHPSWTIHR